MQRKYATNAERQLAYRERNAERKGGRPARVLVEIARLRELESTEAKLNAVARTCDEVLAQVQPERHHACGALDALVLICETAKTQQDACGGVSGTHAAA